jgi:hypothetical protein
MLSTLRRDLDPLDLELLERALEVMVNENDALIGSHKALEAKLRRELTQIARLNGITDAETLHDLLDARQIADTNVANQTS